MSAWPPPPGEIHVRLVRLDVADDRLDELRGLLSPAERERAAGIVNKPSRFVAARGQLRELLAAYVRLPPQDLRLFAGRGGKPALALGEGDPPLRFNASRSGDLALFAVARGRQVGVDIERVREEFDFDRVAARVLSEDERRALRELAPDDRRAAFFATWVRKEAYVKALGTGLASGLSRIHLEPFAGSPARFTAARGGPLVADLDAPPRHVAAVAAAGDGWSVVVREA